MSAAETISSETTALVVGALEKLAQQSVNIQDAHHVVEIEEQVRSSDEMVARKALLTQLQTSFLPSLQQQLADLMKSLNLSPSRIAPTPKLIDTLEIAFKLGNTLKDIGSSANTLAPCIVATHQKSSRIDEDYGVLKKFRCDALLSKINNLISHDLKKLFQAYLVFVRRGQFSIDNTTSSADESDVLHRRKQIIEKSEQVSNLIEGIVTWSRRSDFGVLQDEWEDQANKISQSLAKLTERMNSARRLLVEEIDAELDQPEPEINQAVDTRSETDVSDDSISYKFRIRSLVIYLMQLAVPLVKLCRLFFRKLITSTSKPPFTFGEKMCSADMKWFQQKACPIALDIGIILKTLYQIFDANALNGRIQHMKNVANQLIAHLDCSLVLLSFHLVPSTPLPAPENLFKSYFSPLRYEFRSAMDSFLNGLHSLERN
ncbi:hypothetical protein PGT21_018653 [Puccinia graminis f. sp. tritici]|uniref:Uncharacterized protein n=1 Tax=Puccinia graminis f. sp. tritici TaxID=56615 RepID=A0A5B0QAU7_PUCGR|nr:hypothetical protein PGT21_018653 [Puccinia graminis f. sp. tritici]